MNSVLKTGLREKPALNKLVPETQTRLCSLRNVVWNNVSFVLVFGFREHQIINGETTDQG